jgi:transposase
LEEKADNDNMSYGIDFIKAAVAYKQKGHTFNELKDVFGIPNQTYYLWKRRLERGYYALPKPKQERQRKIDKEKLRQEKAEKPDSYLRELAELFGCTLQSVSAALKNMGITLKKRPSPTVRSPNKSAPSINRE